MKNGNIIYISYCDKDLKKAEELHDKLKADLDEHFTPWVRKKLQIGNNRTAHLEEKIKNSRFRIILLTSNWVNDESGDHRMELELIKKHYEDDYFPIKLNRCKIPNEFRDFTILDFPQKANYEKSYNNLLVVMAGDQSTKDYFNNEGEPIMLLLEKANRNFLNYSKNPNKSPTRLSHSTSYGAGLYSYYKEDYLSALQRMLKPYWSDYPDRTIYSKLGGAYIEEKEYDRAIKILIEGIEKDEEEMKKPKYIGSVKHQRNAINYYNLGLAYKRKHDSLKQEFLATTEESSEIEKKLELLRSVAIEAFTNSFGIKHNHALAYNNLAILYQENGEVEKAIKLLKSKVKIDAQKHLTHYNLGCFLSLQAKTDKELQEALKYLKKAIELDQSNIGYAINDIQLEKLKTLTCKDNLWSFLISEKNAQKTGDFDNSSIKNHIYQTMKSQNVPISGIYYTAILMSELKQADAACYALRIACSLDKEYIDKAIIEPKLNYIKTANNSSKFWRIIREYQES